MIIFKAKRVYILMLLAACLAVGCAQKTPEEKLQQAREYAQNQAYWDAIAVCEDIIKTAPPGDPAAREALLILADCSIRTGNMTKLRVYLNDYIDQYGIEHEEGINSFQNLIKSYIEEAQRSNDPAQIEEAQQKVLELIDEQFENMSADSPFRFRLQALRASLLQMMGNHDEAIEIYMSILNDLEAPLVQRQRAMDAATQSFVNQEDLEGAVSMIQDMLGKDLDSALRPYAYMMIANIYKHEEKEEQYQEYKQLMKDAFRQQMEKVPGADAKTQIMIGEAQALFSIQEFEEAKEILTDAIEKFPNSPMALQSRFLLAQAMLQQNNMDGALQELTTIVEKYPNTPAAQNASQMIQAINQQQAAAQQGGAAGMPGGGAPITPTTPTAALSTATTPTSP